MRNKTTRNNDEGRRDWKKTDVQAFSHNCAPSLAVLVTIQDPGYDTPSAPPTNSLSVAVLTYNLATLTTKIPIPALLSRTSKKPDLIFVTTQETEVLKPRRTEGRRSVSLRRSVISGSPGYTPVAIHSIGGVQGVLMARDGARGGLKSVEVADVACGVGNVVHNKGGVLVMVTMKGGGRMIFVGCHLAAHQGKVKERNEDFRRIREAGEERWGAGVWEDVEGVWWAGDLNYRLDASREEVDCILDGVDGGGGDKAGRLMELDQLTEVRMRGEAWGGMVEGRIEFPMTYKLDKNKEGGGRGGGKGKGKGKGDRWKGLRYDSSAKRRVPSYTDRVLYKPYKLRRGGKKGKEDATTECVWYDWIDEDTGSDHKPVAGGFIIRNL
ncbi:hypothetical protein TrRE_jg10655 [Triparma retinervis]|uniref:Inositol polyphosphate-related phosphatase domain-containing protein n=1 Tax=Triparma retinervis TaxID=2557542 RepID=A0A9W7DVY9_9STRA|nr:hypothetical protein TrRE_jg10655 [Triparma retinervis]